MKKTIAILLSCLVVSFIGCGSVGSTGALEIPNVSQDTDSMNDTEESTDSKEQTSNEEKKEDVNFDSLLTEPENENSSSESQISYSDIHFNNLDTTTTDWYFGRNTEFKRPTGAKDIEYLKQYNAYYIGQDDKTIYLTFDEGSQETFLPEIVEVLDKLNIKGTFFLTKNYILNNKDLVNKMYNNGHLIGNHTNTHPNMTTLSEESFINEIIQVENAFKETTGKEMTKVFRYPEGKFSEQTLDMLNRMGYKSYFWSFAYKDWEEHHPKQVSLDWYNNYYHNGAIYLIHPKNKGNYEALEDFINTMLSKGYSFETVDKIQF